MLRTTSNLTDSNRALIQTLLLFHYIPLHIPDTNKKRKKYKSKGRESTDLLETLPAEEPKAALNILMDRLSIWSALADMSLDQPVEGEGKGKGKGKDEDGWSGILKRFWNDIIVTSYVLLLSCRGPGLNPSDTLINSLRYVQASTKRSLPPLFRHLTYLPHLHLSAHLSLLEIKSHVPLPSLSVQTPPLEPHQRRPTSLMLIPTRTRTPTQIQIPVPVPGVYIGLSLGHQRPTPSTHSAVDKNYEDPDHVRAILFEWQILPDDHSSVLQAGKICSKVVKSVLCAGQPRGKVKRV